MCLRRAANGARSGFRWSSLTAQSNSSPLGWVEVVHPFHPLRGERFEVLKTRCVAGVATIVVRHPERGTCALAQEWTDWAEPSACPALDDERLVPLEFESLLELATLLAHLENAGRVDE